MGNQILSKLPTHITPPACLGYYLAVIIHLDLNHLLPKLTAAATVAAA